MGSLTEAVQHLLRGVIRTVQPGRDGKILSDHRYSTVSTGCQRWDPSAILEVRRKKKGGGAIHRYEGYGGATVFEKLYLEVKWNGII